MLSVSAASQPKGQDKAVFRVPFLIAIALAIAFGGGIWSTRRALDATVGFGAIRLGPWEAFPEAQTDKADPYAKSHRADAGRLLYASAEGLAFGAGGDDAGQPLDARCSYLISGHTPQARFWTLFAVMPGAAPASAASDLPTALNSRSVLRQSDGSLQIAVSTAARPGNWLALAALGGHAGDAGKGDGDKGGIDKGGVDNGAGSAAQTGGGTGAAIRPFRLVLTLLDTPTAGNSGLIDLKMPRIEKTGCDHG